MISRFFAKLLSFFITIIAITAALSTGLLQAADGDLDPSYGTDGKVSIDFGSNDPPYDAVIQPDQKIVVGGYTLGGSGYYDFALARFNPDGSLDISFSSDGKVTTDFVGTDDYGIALAIQDDGKIVVAGETYVSGVGGKFALSRYNPDGSLDTSFSSDGKVLTDVEGGWSGADAIAIQSDQKILAAGYRYNGSSEDFALVRYNPDGTLDTSFSNDGMVTTNINGLADIALGVALQTDGKIVAVGYSFNGTDRDFALARYNPDGSLDVTFSDDGLLTTDFAQSSESARAVVIQNDTKILVAGNALMPSDFALARYNADGTLDTSFSDDGKVTTDFAGNVDIAFDITIQSDGKIVAVGQVMITSDDFGLARYNSDGTLDPNFSGDGMVTTDFGGDHNHAEAVMLQSDNKIVAAGHIGMYGDWDFALARYHSAPPPGTFANNDSYSTPQDTTLNVPPPGVLGNDHDGEGDPLTAVLQTTTSNGSLALNADGSFVYMPDTGFLGTDSFTYFATDGMDNSNVATVMIFVNCLFCDDFGDGILDPNWTYIKQTWNETSGFLVGTPTGRKAIAVASPIFPGCQICNVESEVMTQGGPSNIISILGWYIDKRNTIELLIKEEKDRIILKQRISGTVVAKAKAVVTINPNALYTFRLTFDGTDFIVSMNGSQLFTMTPMGTVPTGTVGFQTKNTTGSFAYIHVN